MGDFWATLQGSMVGRVNRLGLVAALAGGFFLLFLAGSILPLTTTTVFSSPDETAVAYFAHEKVWGWWSGFTIFTGISPYGDLSDIPGLHPRSMVQRETVLVPVGFLGMPLLIVPFEWIWSGLGTYVTVLLVLSSVYALFRLVESFGRKAAWAASIVYLTFPIVILYENRGLFPNLPVVALGLWSFFLIRTQTQNWIAILGGVAFGMALTIRPIEAIWLMPWIGYALWSKRRLKRTVMVGIGMAAMCLLGYLMAVRTYGSWLPTIGYWLKDLLPSPDMKLGNNLNGVVDVSTNNLPTVTQILPFGIHPRAMWSNIETYLFGILGPWVAASLAGLATWWAIRFRKKERIDFIPIILTGWTAFVLLLMYGQSRYADNINQTATIGNSFLRYLLPLVPLIGVGVGMLVETLWKMSDRKRFLAIGLVGFLAIYGMVIAFVRDEESIFPVRQQLIRYEGIRSVAQAMLPPGTIVLSERSDKIFVGLNVVAVSPMPNDKTLEQLAASGARLALFHRMLTPEQKETFAGGLVKDWLLVSVFENEALYLSRP